MVSCLLISVCVASRLFYHRRPVDRDTLAFSNYYANPCLLQGIRPGVGKVCGRQCNLRLQAASEGRPGGPGGRLVPHRGGVCLLPLLTTGGAAGADGPHGTTPSGATSHTPGCDVAQHCMSTLWAVQSSAAHSFATTHLRPLSLGAGPQFHFLTPPLRTSHSPTLATPDPSMSLRPLHPLSKSKSCILSPPALSCP